MKSIKNKMYIIFCALAGIASCTVFREDNLEKTVVVLTSPADKIRSSTLSQTFTWEEIRVSNPVRYTIQIEDDRGRLWTDTITTKLKYTIRLNNNANYTWRVRVQNGGYFSPFSTRTFRVDTSRQLQSSTVILNSPSSGSLITSLIQNFSWQSIIGATRYQLILATPNFTSPTSTYTIDNGNSTSFSMSLTGVGTLPGVGNYEWKVNAFNSNFSDTSSSETRNFVVNNQSMLLNAPAQNESFVNTNRIPFRWTRIGSAVNYRIEIVANTFANPTSTVLNTLVSPDSAQIARVVFNTTGQHQWRATAITSSGSIPSEIRTFSVSPPSPSASAFVAPDDLATVTSSVTLRWDRGSSTLIEGDSLWVYANNTTNLVAGFPIYSTTNQFYTFNAPASGTYFWKIKAKDVFGNTSPVSITRRFATP